MVNRDILNLLRFSNRSGSHVNCIRISTSNSWEHELQKIKVCWNLLKEKRKFLTEAIFLDGKRADIIDLSKGEVIEILHTETVEEFKKKTDSYPIECTYVLTTEEVK